MANSIIAKGLDRKTFRKLVNEKDNLFKDLVIRIRPNEKDLVYYNGNKAFEVDGEEEIRISFPTNVYQCNTTDIKNNYIEKDIINYKNNLIKICNSMSKYFTFKMDRINVKKASEYDSFVFINKINQYNEKHKINNDVQLLCKELENNRLCSIVFETSLSDIESIINAQFDFIDILKLDENKKPNKLINAPIFNFSAIPNVSEIIYNEDSNDLEELITCFKNAIYQYTGKDELEKKYQHQFMLKTEESTDIFKDRMGIFPFEQEYSINDKHGRIDSIFTRIIEDSLEDVYLIELKVNDTVLLGSNGIMKHLDDINYFVTDESKDRNGKNQKQLLLENIRYRYEVLCDKSPNFQFKNSNPRFHFYIIIGFTNDNARDNADNLIKNLFILGDSSIVKQENLNKVSNSNEINNINSIKPSSDKCEIKFFFEKNNWKDGECISVNFIEKYEKELENE